MKHNDIEDFNFKVRPDHQMVSIMMTTTQMRRLLSVAPSSWGALGFHDRIAATLRQAELHIARNPVVKP